MIKFFRHIRQRLLKEGNLVRYLAYAIGEIILVVIGILIALQLNDWKAEQVERELEQTHLQELKEDLHIQLEIIESQMEHENKLALRVDSASAYFKGDLSLVQLESLLYGSGQLGHRKTFVKSQASFNELLSTGGMKSILDPDLRKAIMRHYQMLDYTTKVINTNNGLIDQLFNTNASNNAPSFSLDSNGDLDTTIALTGQERYRIKQSLLMRADLCNIAVRVCKDQRKATLELLDKLDNAMVL